jgi:hypothetical protein
MADTCTYCPSSPEATPSATYDSKHGTYKPSTGANSAATPINKPSAAPNPSPFKVGGK